MPSQIVVEKEKIGDPAPLGLAAFALTTFVASAHFAGAQSERGGERVREGERGTEEERERGGARKMARE